MIYKKLYYPQTIEPKRKRGRPTLEKVPVVKQPKGSPKLDKAPVEKKPRGRPKKTVTIHDNKQTDPKFINDLIMDMDQSHRPYKTKDSVNKALFNKTNKNINRAIKNKNKN